MRKPKPYTLSFRLRSAKHTFSTYQEVYMLLRVCSDTKVAAITGYRVERSDWYALEGQRFKHRNFIHSDAIEYRLNQIREKIDMIYRYQAKKAQIEGWQITTRTVINQFQGLPYVPIKPLIQPCQFGWSAIYFKTGIRRPNAHV